MTSDRNVLFETGRIQLRPSVAADAAFVLALEADPDNAPFIIHWTEAHHLEAMSDPDRAHLIIETRDSAQSIGYIILSALKSAHRSIEFVRITIARKGEGYGRECLRAVKQIVFDTLGAHRLWLDVMSHNVRAKTLYLAEGFVEEGTLRESVEVGGRRVSLIVLSMLEGEFRQEQAREG